MRVVWVLGLAACGRLGFDATPLDATNDGSTDGPTDLIGPPLMVVDPSTLPPFGSPQLVPGLSLVGIEEDDPCLTRDQLEIFFDRNDPNSDLYTSRRATIADPWPTPTPILEINTVATEEHPAISGDGLRLYFSSGRTGGADLYVATRLDRDSPWGNILPRGEEVQAGFCDRGLGEDRGHVVGRASWLDDACVRAGTFG